MFLIIEAIALGFYGLGVLALIGVSFMGGGQEFDWPRIILWPIYLVADLKD